MALRLFLRSPFVVLGAMVMAFTIDVKAALVFVVVHSIIINRYFRCDVCQYSDVPPCAGGT